MKGRNQPRQSGFWRTLFVFVLLALSLSCPSTRARAAEDREQGMPLISTFLPSRFNTPATPVGPQVLSLAALQDGAIVVANNDGLLRLGGTNSRAWNPTHSTVLSLASSDDGTIYVGAIGQIGYFKEFGGEFTSLAAWSARLGVQFGDFWVAVVARDGDVYFADATHVFRWDGNSLSLAYTGQSEMLVGAAFGNGVAVLDPGAGLVLLEGETTHVVRGSERLIKATPCAIASVRDGVVSVCTDGSVLHWTSNGDSVELTVDAKVRELLNSGGVTTAKAREDGSLFIGTRRSGMLWLDSNAALGGRLSGIPDWGDSRVFSLLLRPDAGFWVGLDYGLAYVEWPGQLDRYDALLGLPRAVIGTVRVKGQLLAATTRGLYRLEPSSADQAFAHFEPFVLTTSTLFSVAQSDDILFVASGEGVFVVKDARSEKIDERLAYAVRPLDANGKVLLSGGLRGVRLLRKIEGRWIASDLPGIDTEIRHLQPDADGSLWLTGNYTGAYRVRFAASFDTPPSIEHFDNADGLPDGRVIPISLPGGLVFDSAEGLLRFDGVARRFEADAALRALLPISLGETRVAVTLDSARALVAQHDQVRLIERSAEGVWHELFTPLTRLPRGINLRSIRIDSDGSIWIAGNEALFRHRPDLQSTLPSLPPPQILIERNDERSLPNNPMPKDAAVIALGVAPRSVQVRFEEAFFVGAEQLRFRTRLEPLESAWSDWHQSPGREMTQLPGGHYKLVVQARDIFGRQSETASIAFVLAPPWYLRWWTFVIEGIVLLALLVWMVRSRERILRRRARELAGLVRERTLELEQTSVTDALTGLRNRHYMQLAGSPWSQQENGSWLIALLDIDHFKHINDEHGHAVGDEVLRGVGARLTSALPSDAVIVRWGGEEFLIIVSANTMDQATATVRRLLHTIGDSLVATSASADIAVTCSIGWDVVSAGSAATLDATLGGVDHKLYAAKHAGRDCACGPGESIVIRRLEA